MLHVTLIIPTMPHIVIIPDSSLATGALQNQCVVGRVLTRHVGLKPDLRSNGLSGIIMEGLMRTSTSERVQKHRAVLRAAGLRPVQIWVPDTRRAGFDKECRRQSFALREDANERETLNWLEAAADTDGWK